MAKQILIVSFAVLSMQPAYSMEFNKCSATYNAANLILPPASKQQVPNAQKASAISSYLSKISSCSDVGSRAHPIITAHYCPQTSKEEDHPVGILCLPSEVLENICFYLRLKDVSALRRSCKQFRFVWPHEKVLQFDEWELQKFTGEMADWLAAGIAFLSNKLKDCRNPLKLDLINYFPKIDFTDAVDGYHLTELPHEIKQLPYLQRLNLSRNRLSQGTIRNLCTWLSILLELDLSYNELTELPREIQQLSHLQKLVLSCNDLSQDAIRNLCSWLPNLVELDLGGNELTELPQEIQQLSHLQKLVLSCNDLSQDAIRNLCSWLPNLVELDLSRNELTELPQEIQQLSHLQRLALMCNFSLGRGEINTIAQWLPKTKIEVQSPVPEIEGGDVAV